MKLKMKIFVKGICIQLNKNKRMCNSTKEHRGNSCRISMNFCENI